MTVRELKERLSGLPEDYEVHLNIDLNIWRPVTKVGEAIHTIVDFQHIVDIKFCGIQ